MRLERLGSFWFTFLINPRKITFSISVTTVPENLVGYRGYNGQIYTFTITASASGSTSGTTIYTDDSTLATAVIHAGYAVDGQLVTVTIIILGGQSSYTGSTQNGVTSNSYGPFPGSYQILSGIVIGWQKLR